MRRAGEAVSPDELVRGEESQDAIAEKFGVHPSTADKWWHRWRTTDSCAALPHASGPARTLQDCDPILLEACAYCGVPAREIPAARALELEPRLNPRLLAAIQIPDGVFDPYRFCLSFLATAHRNGARVLTYIEVVGLELKGQTSILGATSWTVTEIPPHLPANPNIPHFRYNGLLR